jgi:acetylornithine aminotransferase
MDHILPLTDTGNIEITKAGGCYLHDAEGNSYLDLESGVWCINLGHNHRRINRVIQRQLENATHLGYQVQCRLPELLSQTLLKKMRLYGGRSVFLSSGSEAVDLSITIAKRITGRKNISTIEGSYLGAYGQGQNSPENKAVINIPNNDYEKLASSDFSKIAAFVFEPGSCRGMIRFPSVEFISALVKKAKAAGTLIVVDEVTTGMGRTGKWFGYEHYRLIPDMVVCGKGLGNGYPVSSVSLSRDTAALFLHDPIRYAQSHQNDPLGCAIALAVIKEIERSGLVQKTEENGIFFKSLLKDIANKYNAIKDIRGFGYMIAIEFTDENQARSVHQALFNERMICGIRDNVLRLMPPLVMEHRLIQQVVEKIDQSVSMIKIPDPDV